MKGFSILVALALFVLGLNGCYDPEIEAAKKRAEVEAIAKQVESTQRLVRSDIGENAAPDTTIVKATFLESQIAHAAIIIKPGTELKISKEVAVKVYGFSDVDIRDVLDALIVRKVSNAIVLGDGVDKVDVMIGSPKLQNKETWRVVREGSKIQLVRPNGFIVEPATTRR